MKKVGIVTIISQNNGNRLQNYALQEVIKRFDCSSYTIPIVSYEGKQSLLKITIKQYLALFFKRYQFVFWDMFNQRINWNKHAVKDMSLDEIQSFDYFIAGSDQIWNPLFNINSDREFLVFAEKKQRIAYAASIGLSNLPEEYKSRYNRNLNGIPFISVREKEAAEIVKNLIGREVQVVLDPTMLLTTKEWDKVINYSRLKINKKYVLKYILGDFSEECNAYIEKQVKENNLEIIDIETYSNKNGIKLGPCEFLYLIKNSRMVFTDSFHATIFSILFHKQFVVFNRAEEEGYGEMSSRLNTLLNMFNLEENKIKGDDREILFDNSIDYSSIDIILESKRKESYSYLEKILKSK